MNDLQKHVTSYFKNALTLSTLESVKYSSQSNNGSFYAITRDELNNGILPQKITEALFEPKRNRMKSPTKQKGQDSQEINLVISLVSIQKNSLKKNSSKDISGLLNILATLTRDGKLNFDVSQSAPCWIPRERLKTEHGETLEVMVGELSDFWHFEFKKGEELRSRIESGNWQQYLTYAQKMYDDIQQDVAKAAEEAGYEYIDNECYVALYERINPNKPIIDLYDHILGDKREHPLYSRMIALDSPRAQSVVNDDKIDGDKSNDASLFLENAVNTYGSMSCKFPLAYSQRKAVHAFQKTNNGEVLTVSGPPGTGKTTMLQSIVASTIVSRAINKKDAPIIVGTSTNNQAVTNIIKSFSSVVAEEHGALDFRWIPCATEGEAAIATLSGIAVYCPAITKLKESQQQGFLCEQSNRSVAYTDYSEETYVKQARLRVLDNAESYFGFRPSSIKDLKDQLFTRLESVDECRRQTLTDCYNFYKGNSLDSHINDLEQCQFDIKEKYKEQQGYLEKWSAEQSKRKHGILAKIFHSQTDDRVIIAACASISESLPDSIDSLDEVVAYYQNCCASLQSQYEKTCVELKKLHNEKEHNRQVAKSFNIDIKEINVICGNAKYAGPQVLNYQIDNNDANVREQLKLLDEALDTTLRYIEFWLAVHYYECEWLSFCEEGAIISKDERFKTTETFQKRYWQQAPALTPCFVMTEYQVPKYFSIYKNSEHLPDFERIDLLITDEAGQVNTPIGLASFALAKRAVVVGDTHQLSPIWFFEEEEDKSIAKDNGVPDSYWDNLKNAGLTCSQPSSLMKVAKHACKWRYSEEEAGLFLEEHYRCVKPIIEFCNDLIYRDRLKPRRSIKNSKLYGATSPFLFRGVSGSQDVREGSSRSNRIEAEEIVHWIISNREFLENRYDREIKDIVGVVTPFAAQASLVRTMLSEYDPVLSEEMTIGTAHRLQGAELPVILFSITYGESAPGASFINNNPELINVAVSRAKDLFIVFGAEKWLNDGGQVLKVLARHAVKDDCLLAVSE